MAHVPFDLAEASLRPDLVRRSLCVNDFVLTSDYFATVMTSNPSIGSKDQAT